MIHNLYARTQKYQNELSSNKLFVKGTGESSDKEEE